MPRPAVVATTTGRVRGAFTGGVHRFAGIPFAAPPVGDRWMQSPEAPVPWTDVRDTTAFGPTAPQPATGFGPDVRRAGDDYLNLNVWTPDPTATGLPVAVWFHGGGSVEGTNASSVTDGHAFARDGVVFVAPSYRLGVEGFVPVDGAPVNRALKDWLAALDWIQHNIAAFGGDPRAVTIMGQSAGSGAVGTLLAVAGERALFQRAIGMSGVAFNLSSVDQAAALGDELCAELGVARTSAALAAVAPDALLAAQARLVPVGPKVHEGLETVLAAMANGPVPIGVVVGDNDVPVAPLDAIASGAGHAVTVLAGTTAGEADGLGFMAPDLDDAELIRLLGIIGLDANAAARYRGDHASLTPSQVLGRATTDIIFRLPTAGMALRRAAATAPTFLYEFAWHPNIGLGAPHCIDLPFVFDTLAEGSLVVFVGTDPPQALADEIHAAFVAFIKSGDPGWPAYEPGGDRSVMVFDQPSAVVSDPHAIGRAAFGDVPPI